MPPTEVCPTVGSREYLGDVAARFGVCPSFFSQAAEASTGRLLWDLAQGAYLDNPLPSRFKEVLFTYLSRYSSTPYCMARHVAFLMGRGAVAGDPLVPRMGPGEVVELLRRPTPTREDLEAGVGALARCEVGRLPIGVEAEGDERLQQLCTAMFLQLPGWESCRDAVRRALGSGRFEQLLLLLDFVRFAHFWTEGRGDLAREADVDAVLEVNASLREWVETYREEVAAELGSWRNAAEGRGAPEREMPEVVALLRREIEERQRVEAERRHVSQRMARALEHAAVGIWEYHQSSGVVSLDPQCQALLNIPRPHISLRGLLERIQPDDRDGLARKLVRARRDRGGAEYSHTIRIAGEDGAFRWLECRGRAVDADALADPMDFLGVFLDVTRHQETLRRLSESEDRFRRAARASPSLIYEWFPQEGRVYRSGGLKRILGYHAGEVPPTVEAWHELMHPEDLARLKEQFAALTADPRRERVRSEYRVRHKDGHWVEVEDHALMSRAPEGTILRVIGTTTDVSAQKRAEADLREQRAFLQEVVDALGEGLIVADRRGRVTLHNEAFRRKHRLEPSQVQGWAGVRTMRHFELEDLSGNRLEMDRWPLWRALRGETFSSEVLRVRRDDAEVDFFGSYSGHAIHNPDGTVRHAIVTVRNVTAQIVAQRALREREAELVRIADTVPFLIARVDKDYRYEFVNAEYERRFKRSASEFIGRSVAEIAGEEAIALARPRFEAALRGEEQRFELPILGRPEGEIHLDVHYVPIFEPDGTVECVYAFISDITKIKQNEVALREAKEAAEAASRAKTTFIASMSHDIRTPLTAIIGFAEILSQVLPSEQQELVEPIQASSRQLLSILNSVLELARLEGQQVRLRVSAVLLAKLVREVVGLFRETAMKKGLTLEEECPEDVGAWVNPDGLQRALMNVVSNAIKYTDSGGVRVTVTRRGSEVAIVVRDTGSGIAADFLPHLFEPYARDRRGRGRAEHGPDSGTGLGLSITRRLVELMEGTVAVTSEEGAGTEVVLTFPGAKADVATAVEAARVPSARKRLLVVEDNPSTRLLLKTLLKDIELEFAGDADEARAAFAQFRPDVVFLDIDLGPGASGLEILPELKALAEGQEVRFVACTAHALPEDEGRYAEAGFHAYLSKPFTAESMRRVLFDA